MAFKFFGIKIGRDEQATETRKTDPSKIIAAPAIDDGALFIQAGGLFGYYLNLDFSTRSESDLVNRYRDIACQPEPDNAVMDIVNEAIVMGEGNPVDIDLDDSNVTDQVKESITKEFKTILRLLDFNNSGSDIFKKWFIDGRIAYQNIVDKKNTESGIINLIPMDSRKLRKIKNIITERTDSGTDYISKVEEFFVYSDTLAGTPIQNSTNQGNVQSVDQEKALKILPDSISYATSGLVNGTTGFTLSYLHKAIKPMNQLRMIEDAVVIYRLARAPERRIFNVQTRGLSPPKAEQYVNDQMNKFRNRTTYDSATGQVIDDRKHMSMLEDFWFAQDSDGKGTTVTNLPAGQNLGEIQDVVYFQKRLYQSLNVPVSRLMQPDKAYQIGAAEGSDQILRDELKFSRFIDHLRSKFTTLFDDILRKQLVLRKIISQEEWDEIKEGIHYKFATNSYFAELKKNEILKQRLELLGELKPWIGKLFSKEWVEKNVLQRTDEESKEIAYQIENEKSPEDIRKKSKDDSEEELDMESGGMPPSMSRGNKRGGGPGPKGPALEEPGAEPAGPNEAPDIEAPPEVTDIKTEKGKTPLTAEYKPSGNLLRENVYKRVRSSRYVEPVYENAIDVKEPK